MKRNFASARNRIAGGITTQDSLGIDNHVEAYYSRYFGVHFQQSWGNSLFREAHDSLQTELLTISQRLQVVGTAKHTICTQLVNSIWLTRFAGNQMHCVLLIVSVLCYKEMDWFWNFHLPCLHTIKMISTLSNLESVSLSLHVLFNNQCRRNIQWK